jgi:type IV pilus assembly protein PilC
MLNAIADFFDEDLDTRVARLLALVEPIIVSVMAIAVAGLLLAFYMPMFQIFSSIAG